MNSKADVIVRRKSILGEGAIWSYRDKLLYWVDILDHKIFVYNPTTGENKSFDVKEYPSSIVPRSRGKAVITLKNGFATFNFKNERCEMLKCVEEELEGNRFNDGKCDPKGRFWAGTMAFDLTPEKGGLYNLDTQLKVTKVLGKVSCSNGIVWNRHGTKMYYIDSLTQEIQEFAYNLDTGGVSNPRSAVRIPKNDGLPDGMSIDEEGMLWVALFGGERVNRYDPETGRCIGGVSVPKANLVTSCAFGGSKLDKLYITTASCDYTNEDWSKWPDAGSLFVAYPGVRGVPAMEFKR